MNDRQNVAAILNQWASELHLVAHRDSGTVKCLDEFALNTRHRLCLEMLAVLFKEFVPGYVLVSFLNYPTNTTFV